MMQLLNKKRKLIGNKGFSLVELIIVIAIIAVLVAILAPQYIKYVEKSRVSADASQVDQITSAIKVLLSDEAYDGATGFTVTWSGDKVTVGGTDKDKAEAELGTSLGKAFASDAFDAKIQANANKGKAYKWTVTYEATTKEPSLATTDWTAAPAG